MGIDFQMGQVLWDYMARVKRIWYLSPMQAAKVQASLRIRVVSPEPPLLAHTSSESRGTFRQKARSLAPLNGWACAVKICHDGMLEDTNWLDGAHISQCEIWHVCFSRMPNLQTIKSENKMNMNNYRAWSLIQWNKASNVAAMKYYMDSARPRTLIPFLFKTLLCPSLGPNPWPPVRFCL